MSRLVCLDLSANPQVLLQGKKYTVYINALRPPLLTLREADGGSELPMTRNELATLVGKEVATLVDELDEPEEPERPEEPGDPGVHQDSSGSEKSRRAKRSHTDISHLRMHRVLDWHAKMFMLIRILPLRGASPKSKLFVEAVRSAQEELSLWWAEMGIAGGGKKLSAWTLYHIVLQWRKRRYSLATFQKKGVEYSPWVKRSKLRELAKQLVEAMKLDNPSWTIEKIRQEVEMSLTENNRLAQGET